MSANSSIIDVNITLGQWPTRRVPCEGINKLVAKLRDYNVSEAWAGHYDGLFHTDLTAVEEKETKGKSAGVPLAPPVQPLDRDESLAKPVAPHRPQLRLIPFGSVNPLTSNWEPELDRCAAVHRMAGVRLHPNYHNYKLDHPNFAALLKAAAERNLIVQLTTLMEDARMMHPLMRVPPVDLAPLEKLVSRTPKLRLILLNALTTPARTDPLARLINAGEVYVDIATLETIAALETLLKDIPPDRILFGSHSPSFYFEAAWLKLQESRLPNSHLRAIAHENARQLLRKQ